jgi:hypothetical protein
LTSHLNANIRAASHDVVRREQIRGRRADDDLPNERHPIVVQLDISDKATGASDAHSGIKAISPGEKIVTHVASSGERKRPKKMVAHEGRIKVKLPVLPSETSPATTLFSNVTLDWCSRLEAMFIACDGNCSG